MRVRGERERERGRERVRGGERERERREREKGEGCVLTNKRYGAETWSHLVLWFLGFRIRPFWTSIFWYTKYFLKVLEALVLKSCKYAGELDLYCFWQRTVDYLFTLFIVAFQTADSSVLLLLRISCSGIYIYALPVFLPVQMSLSWLVVMEGVYFCHVYVCF